MAYEKATIEIPSDHSTITAKYNPTEYTISRQAQYDSGNNGQLTFKEEQVDPFSVTLFFDTYEAKTDVRDQYAKIVALTHPSVAGKERKQPPECIFHWGTFSYKGRVQKVEQKITLFLQDGTPVRASVTVAIKPTFTSQEYDELQGKEACRKLWRVKVSDRLDQIANQLLFDPAKWRIIADANAIGNPLTFPTAEDIGRILVIPDD